MIIIIIIRSIYIALYGKQSALNETMTKRKTNELGWVGEQKCLEEAFEHRHEIASRRPAGSSFHRRGAAMENKLSLVVLETESQV